MTAIIHQQDNQYCNRCLYLPSLIGFKLQLIGWRPRVLRLQRLVSASFSDGPVDHFKGMTYLLPFSTRPLATSEAREVVSLHVDQRAELCFVEAHSRLPIIIPIRPFHRIEVWILSAESDKPPQNAPGGQFLRHRLKLATWLRQWVCVRRDRRCQGKYLDEGLWSVRAFCSCRSEPCTHGRGKWIPPRAYDAITVTFSYTLSLRCAVIWN